ncbi:copper chaperone PCu(A)C [Bradyrhizobium sp. STM 3562]|uniref:copper chaperone PCu(A)C n=1 Tax=Bradyrhizobium sp. STM 3562 TaxID=578924 RepID=UPI00388EAD6D
MRALACAAMVSCFLSSPSPAEDAAPGSLIVSQPWSRATPGGAKVAGGYLTIKNRGDRIERLLSASTSLAQRTEIHQMAMIGGIMTMRPAAGGLIIEPGHSVTLAPGGTHLMFEGINAAFRQGDRVPVTLDFEQAGAMNVMFEVQSLGAQAPATRAAEPATTMAAAAPVDDDSFFTHLHAVKAMANVTVSPGRAGPVEIAIQLENADELPLSAEAVSVTLADPEHGIAPVTEDAERVSGDQWRVKMSAPLAGRWSLGLRIRLSASDTVDVVSPILLR